MGETSPGFGFMEKLFTVLTGLGLIVIGLFYLYKNKKLIKNGILTNGVVIRLEHAKDLSLRRDLFPVVRFLTDQKEWITFTSSVGAYPAPFDEGDKVDVLYSPENPSIAEIKNTTTLYFVPI